MSNGGPVERESTKTPEPRTSVAFPFCHHTALTTITRPITVAAGVFAPGHLGELTRIIDFEMVDAVLAQTRTRECRLRSLPSRVGLYFVLALALFPSLGYRGVWGRLTSALDPASGPSAKASRDVRRRLGPAPVRELFGLLAGPAADPHTPIARFAGYRTVSFDGCRSIKVPGRPDQPGLAEQAQCYGRHYRLPQFEKDCAHVSSTNVYRRQKSIPEVVGRFSG